MEEEIFGKENKPEKENLPEEEQVDTEYIHLNMMMEICDYVVHKCYEEVFEKKTKDISLERLEKCLNLVKNAWDLQVDIIRTTSSDEPEEEDDDDEDIEDEEDVDEKEEG